MDDVFLQEKVSNIVTDAYVQNAVDDVFLRTKVSNIVTKPYIDGLSFTNQLSDFEIRQLSPLECYHKPLLE